MQKKTDRFLIIIGAKILPRKTIFKPFVSCRIMICHFYRNIVSSHQNKYRISIYILWVIDIQETLLIWFLYWSKSQTLRVWSKWNKEKNQTKEMNINKVCVFNQPLSTNASHLFYFLFSVIFWLRLLLFKEKAMWKMLSFLDKVRS